MVLEASSLYISGLSGEEISLPKDPIYANVLPRATGHSCNVYINNDLVNAKQRGHKKNGYKVK